MAIPERNSKNMMFVAALEYGQRGWPIIPLWWPLADGRCACNTPNCDNAGKHPLISNWPSRGTTDLGQISKWWKQWPEANIGMITGKKTGLLLLDIDLKDDGPEREGIEGVFYIFREFQVIFL